jgi:myo-inositol-1(or 4)-monophosphatase
VREAGGFVTDFRGSDAGLVTGQILAANDQIHSRLHKLVGGALRS